MSKIKTFGKLEIKNGVKTFSMSLKELNTLYKEDKAFRELWKLYKQRTNPEWINERFNELLESHPMLEGKVIPKFITDNKHLMVKVFCSYNAEGNITNYPHRDLLLPLIIAYKFSMIQNYSVKHSVGYEYDYLLCSSEIVLILPHENVEAKISHAKKFYSTYVCSYCRLEYDANKHEECPHCGYKMEEKPK